MNEGRVPYKVENGMRMQGVTGFKEKKGVHSKKPFKMYEMIEKVSYAPFFELFARECLLKLLSGNIISALLPNLLVHSL